MLGETISHYRIRKQLGAGGMGVVYEAVDTKLDRTVALKFLPPESTRDPQAKTRFIREAKAAAGLSHPNIATIYEVDESDGQLFIAMECVEGQSLRERIATGPLPVPEALDLGRQIAAGLQEAHDKGIVHRDIKPANIMITPKGVAKILDFGLAWSADATKLTRTGTTVGTIVYLSPEQAKAENVDHRTDIWALGSVLHEMIAGRPPFSGEHEQAILYAVLHKDPEPLTGLRTGVPLELERIVGKTLRKDPALRYQTARGLSADLQALAQTDAGALSDTRELAMPRKGPSRRAGIIGVVAAALLVVIALKVWSPLAPPATDGEEPTLAVLVFRNLGATGHLEYLAAGISEDLIVNLHDVPGLSVLSRGAVEQFRDEATDPREVGRTLGCDYVLDGSVRVAGESLKLTAMLADAQTGAQVWARSYDAATEEIFALQDSIQTHVGTALGLVDPETGSGILSPRWTQNIEAYSYYLAAREISIEDYSDPRTPSLMNHWLDKALALDPFYAPALADRAVLLTQVDRSGIYLPDRHERARQLIHSAKNIDPRSAAVWDAEGRVLSEFDREAALASTRRAIELNPSVPEAYNNLGLLLWEAGEKEEALAAWDMVAKVDPYFSFGLANAAIHYCEAGELTRAQEVVDEALLALPDNAALRFSQSYVWDRSGNKDAAIVGLRENIATNPDHFHSYEYLGDLYESQARFAEADSVYLVIAERWPHTPISLERVGTHFMGRRDLQRAESYLRRAIQEDTHALYARVQLVECLYDQGKTGEARAELAEIERIWPEDFLAAGYIAWCYRWLERNLEAAEQWYLRGLESAPQYTYLLRQLANLQRRQGRFGEAAEVLERLIEVDPRDHAAYGELALLRSNLGQWDAAIDAAEAAVDMMPAYSDGWRHWAEALRSKGDLAGAHAVLDEGLAVLPNDALLRHTRALLWKSADDVDAAMNELRENIAVNPGYLDSYEHLGDLYQSEERFAEADSLHLLIAARWPDLPKAFRIVGGYFYEREDFERAEPYFRRAIEKDARFLWPRYRLARCLYEQEKIEEARAEIAEIERIWPEDPMAANYIAWCYRHYEKDLEAAEQWYLRGLATVPYDPVLLRNLASLYRQNGRYTEAMDVLDQVLAVNPRDHVALSDLASTQRLAGRFEDAISSARAAIDVREDIHRPWYELAWGQIQLCRRHEAAISAERAASLGSKEQRSWGLALVGEVQYLEGRFRQALATFKQAAANSSKPHEHLLPVAVTAWLVLDDEKEARQACTQIIEGEAARRRTAKAMEFLALIEADAGNHTVADSLFAQSRVLREQELEENPSIYSIRSAALFCARSGDEERTRELIDELVRKSPVAPNERAHCARAMALIGDNDAAFEHLASSIDLGFDAIAVLDADREFAELRKDPRYEQIVGDLR